MTDQGMICVPGRTTPPDVAAWMTRDCAEAVEQFLRDNPDFYQRENPDLCRDGSDANDFEDDDWQDITPGFFRDV